ncbi:hypothetical protein HYT23_03975 [Candidatus Pacearchaeota archaeon]|nr:hypothetical protein [Candidatus Pacearchaeota archaeon]
MKNIYPTAKRMAKNIALAGLAALALGGCSNKFDSAIEMQKQREFAKRYTSQCMQDMDFRQYAQRNGARVATKDYGNESVVKIDANGNGFYEKTLTFDFGQKPRIEVDSGDGAVFGFPQ